MKRILFSSLLVLMAIGMRAQTFTIGDFTYKVTDADAKTVSLNKLATTFAGELTVPSSVENEGTAYTVTSIDANACKNCTSITSITLPSTVTTVGDYAFGGCSAVTAINIEASENALTAGGSNSFRTGSQYTLYVGRDITYGSGGMSSPFSNITSLECGGQMTTVCPRIGMASTSTLQSVTIGVNGGNNIDIAYAQGSGPFWGCTKLANITLGDHVANIGGSAFRNCGTDSSVEELVVSLGHGVQTIGENAFNGCTKIKNITIPASVTSVGNTAFGGCSAVTAINIEASENALTAGGSNSFRTGSQYALYIGRDITYGSSGMSSPFSNITSLECGGQMTTFCDRIVMASTSTLQSVTIGVNGGNNINIAHAQSSGVFQDCTKLSNITIGDNVANIGGSAFYNCGTDDSVEKLVVSLGHGVQTIGDNAFYGCTKLTSIEIPSGVTRIGAGAFSYSGLTSVSIPASVETIGNEAFNFINTLERVTIEDGDTPLTLENSYYGAFQNGDGGGADYFTRNIYIGRNIISYNNRERTEFDTAVEVVIGSKVTTITNSMFNGCQHLQSVVIGNGVTSVGNNAFRDCGIYVGAEGQEEKTVNQMTVTMGENITTIGDYAFYNCAKLTSIEIPSGVTRIGAGAFSFSGITSVTIPASVETIGNEAFNFIDALERVTIEDGDTPLTLENSFYGAFQNGTGDGADYFTRYIYIGRNINSYNNRQRTEFDTAVEVVIGPKVTSITNSMFDGCQHLQSVVIGSGVTSIGNNAFQNCGKFVGAEGQEEKTVSQMSVTMGENITAIGDNAFYGCTKLTSIEIPSGVTRIGEGAFSYSGITSVTIPASVETIGNEAFNFINALECVTIEDGDTPLTLENSYYGAFQNGDAGGTRYTKTVYLGRNIISYNNRQRTEFDTVEELTIGPNVTELPSYAFYGCEGLTTLDLTKATGLTALGSNAFYNCTNLTALDLSKTKITELAERTFYNCNKLTTFSLPNTLTTIGNEAFTYCAALDVVTIPASVTTIGDCVFYYTDKMSSFTIEDSDTPLEIGDYGDGLAGETFYLGRDVTGLEGTTKSSRLVYTNAKNVTLGPKVTTLFPNMFNGSQMTTFNWSQATGITTIPDRCFNDCDGITEFTIPANITTIESSAFWYMGADIIVTIADSETPLTLHSADSYHYPIFESNNTVTAYVGRNIVRTGGYEKNPVFDDSLVGLSFGSNVTAIGDNEYYNCSNVADAVTGLANVVSIGEKAFNNCQKMTSIELGTKLTTMGDYAFQDCQKLGGISLPGSLKKVPLEAFENCFALATVTLGEGIEEIANGAFYDTDALTEITIPASVKKIGRAPFYCNNKQAMKRMIIADSDTPLEFANGTSGYNWGRGNITDDICLEYFYLGRDVTRANTDYSLVYNVNELEIGEKVTDLGILFWKTGDMDNESERIKNVKVHWTTPIAISEDAFHSKTFENATLWVPGGTEAAYQAEDNNWKKFVHMDFASYLVSINATKGGTLAVGDLSVTNGETATTLIDRESEVVFNVTANEGYELKAFTVNGEDQTLTEGKYTVASLLADQTVAATFSPITYTLSYELAGGSVEVANPTTYNVETETFTLNNPTKTGYTFKGWKLNGEGEAMMSVVIAKGSTGNKAYTATWQINQYTITFNSNGGTEVDPITQDYNTAVTAPDAPTREGYTFAGWTPEVPATIPAENIELTAQWTINQYTITFNTNGGSTIDPITQDYNTTVTAPADPTREGYTFAGWTPALPATMPAENISVSANWTKKTFTVSITGAGVTADNMTPEFGDNVVITIAADEDRTLTSLTVNGADVTAQVVNNQYTITNVTGNITIVATFTSTKEFITLNSDVATFSCSQDLNFTGSSLKAYIAAGYNKAENITLLVRVYDVPAGTGLILKGTQGQTYKIPYATSASYYVNLLKANLTAQHIEQTSGEMSNYLLNKKNGEYGFYKPSETSTLGAQKAYLQVPTSFVTAEARVIKFVFEDDDVVTNIEDFEMLAQPGAEGLYNLNGLRVKTPGKGIYIQDGRKVVKK